jgi:hypothetical protein
MTARKVDIKEFSRVYRAGWRVEDIMKHFGITSRTTVKDNRKAAGLKARPKGWPNKK